MADSTDEKGEILEQGVYIWTSNGGCEACDALAGEHLEEPARPHENCQCEITWYPKNKKLCANNEVEIEFVDAYGEERIEWDSEFSLTYEFIVTCRDGSRHYVSSIVEAVVPASRLPTAPEWFRFVDNLMDQALETLELPPGCDECEEPVIC